MDSTKESDIEKHIEQIRKEIALIEWDLPKIKNSELRITRTQRLTMYKWELEKALAGRDRAEVS